MVRQSQQFLSQVYALLDFVVIQIIFYFTWWLKFKSGWIPSEAPLPFSIYQIWSIVYGLIAILTGFFLLYYSPKRKKQFSFETAKIVQIHILSLFTLLSILFVVKEIHISRLFLAVFVCNNILFHITYRYILKSGLKQLRKNGYNKQFLLVIGAGNLGKKFYRNLRMHPELGYEVIGFLDDNLTKHQDSDLRLNPILGRLDDLSRILQSKVVDEVIVALPLAAHEKLGDIINVCEKTGVKVLIIPDYFDYLPARPHFDNFAGIPLINVRYIPLDDFRNRLLKRAFDITFSICAIILTAPLLMSIALAIKVTSPGPILFCQERVGLNRRHFKMYKFRSMRVMPQGISDTQWTTQEDPRRTKIGVFLRKTSLDELPQFFNVLFGEMSVVGPRPERPYYVEQFKEEIPKYMIKHHIRPGMTGWAQTNGLRGNTSIEERIKHDLFYIENWNFLMDIRIIYKTILEGFVNKNAY